LGITVYPLFRDLAWPDYPQLPQNADGVVEFPGGAPATADNALNLGMMTRQERGAYVSLKQRQFEEYGKLGEDTGGRSDDPRDSLESILADIEYREDWAYAAGIAPSGAPRAHRLEVRLRDPNSGALQGGTRTAVY
jgi:hypothetical protein